MPLQDLTPQLRTRLSRVERTVGLFITLATLLLLAGFAYYIHHTAQRKGWFVPKIKYSTSLNNAAGLKPGDPIKLMGFNVGEVTEIQPNDPWAYYGVTIFFWVKEPYFGYIWRDSKVRAAASDFLGNRNLEIIKGTALEPTVRTNLGPGLFVLNFGLLQTNFDLLKSQILADYIAAATNNEDTNFSKHMIAADATNHLNALVAKNPDSFYTNAAKAAPYWIEPMESPALGDRLQTVADAVEAALPNILNLTNQINAALTNISRVAARADSTLAQTHPLLTNFNAIASNLNNPHGGLGEWLFPTNLNAQLEKTLETAKATLLTAQTTFTNADTNLNVLTADLTRSLAKLSNITSNLDSQLQANTNVVTEVSTLLVHVDDLVQGLKRHWLLRSAFKTNKTSKVTAPATSPKIRR